MSSEKAYALEQRYNAWLARKQLVTSPVASQHVASTTVTAITWDQGVTPQVVSGNKYRVSGTLFCQPTSTSGALKISFSQSGCTMANIRVGFLEAVTVDGVGSPGTWGGSGGFGATVKAESDVWIGSTWGAGEALRQTWFDGEINCNGTGSLVLGVAMNAAGNTWDVLYGSCMEITQVLP